MTGSNHTARRTGVTVASLFIASALALPPEGHAQDLTLVPAQDRATTMRLVADREESAIEADLDAARNLSAALEAEVEGLRLDLAEAKAAVDVKESEIDVIKTRKDLADKQDKEAEKKAFEEQEKDEELQKRLLERHVDLLERQIEYARARREASRAAERVFQAEMRLESVARDLEELQDAEEGSLTRAMQLQAEFSKLEKDVLEAQREYARRKETEAGRERRVIEARLEIVEARERIRSS
ncbi:MAG: hypothetical protein OEO23_04630 [Gemmatimonadota bacterium]|nr:hypothetical protein [Gemmatimonadota bacterium]